MLTLQFYAQIHHIEKAQYWLDQIELTDPYYSHAQYLSAQMLLTNAPLHKPHHPSHTPEERLAIKSHNRQRRDALWQAYEAAYSGERSNTKLMPKQAPFSW